MRKITLFLALMVAMITTAFAQTDVPATNKFYTVVAEDHNSGARPQWAINDEGNKFVSTGNNVISTDAQKQFAFVSFEGKTYIYSISAKKFVMKDASLAEKKADAIEITQLENGKFFFRFDASHNVNIGGSKQMTIDGWNTVDGGNQFTLVEEGDFDATEALLALNTAVEITYIYMYNGVEIGREKFKEEIGNAYPAAGKLPYGFVAEIPDGVVKTAGMVVVECGLMENYPIKFAATADEITTWYYIQMHSNNKRYIQYIPRATSIEWADAEIAEGEEDTYTWAFVGNPLDGFKLVNYAAGKEMAVCSDGSSDPILGAFEDAVVWKTTASDVAGDSVFCLAYPGGNYMNAQNGKVAYWNDNDAGSTLMLTEREMPIEPEQPEVDPIVATISPSEPVAKIWGDGDVTIAFNKAVEYTAPEAGIQIVDANNEVVCNVSLIFNSEKTSAFVILDNSISQAGTYTMTIPAGAFTSEDGAVSAELSFTLIVEAVVPEPTWWTDYDYTEVTNEFSKLTISFDNLTELKINNANATRLFTSAGTEHEGTAEIVKTVDEKEGKEFTKIEITFGETFTDEGTYYITIPAGMFTMNGEFNNEEKNLMFKISAPVEITPLEVVSVTPKFGENGQFEEVEIVYNQQVYCGDPENSWSSYVVNLTDENGVQYPMWQKDPYDPAQGWAQVIPSNTVVLIPVKLNDTGYPYEYNEYWQVAASPITNEGKYTLNLAEVYVRYGYDKAIYDYNTNGYVEGIYTWTVTETSIEDIEAEAENAEIYDITGRRVKNITNAGIYIVNGKKILVK